MAGFLYSLHLLTINTSTALEMLSQECEHWLLSRENILRFDLKGRGDVTGTVLSPLQGVHMSLAHFTDD